MKKILLYILMALLFSCQKTATNNVTDTPPVPASTEKGLKILYFIAPPHIFKDESGKLTGAVYDFIQEDIGPAMGVDFVWSEERTAIPREIEMIRNDPDIVLALLSVNDERKQEMAFSETPYFTDTPAITLLKSSPLQKVNSIDDLMDLTIGYAIGGYRTPLVNNDSLKFELLSNSNYIEANLIKLTLERIDAVYAPGKSTLIYDIEKLGISDKIKILDLPDTRGTYYIVFSKLAPELAKRYNAAFRKTDGQKKYFEKLKRYINTDLLTP